MNKIVVNNELEENGASTEQRILDAVGELVVESGFEQVGINAVAKFPGVSKVLIYRYFTSIDGLLAEYVRRHNFWINFPQDEQQSTDLVEFIKSLFLLQMEQLHSDWTRKRLTRWELSTQNKQTETGRAQREEVGVNLSTAATIAPANGSPKLGVPGDFSAPRQYVVTAVNGSTKTWTISVTALNK